MALLRTKAFSACKTVANAQPVTHFHRVVSSALRQRSGVVAFADAPGPKSSIPSNKLADEPVWVRREKERELQANQPGGAKLPWPVALLLSVIVAIAATGSIFEFVDKNPIFGVVQPDSPLWAPILLFMAVTGYPVAGFLFKFGVDEFNAMAEQQDRLDGYLPDDRK